MLETLTQGFEIFFSVYNFVALFIGVAVGVFLGAIPGMTATMAVALALPFTFTLEPVVGILLLLGVYKGGIYGGSIPAILVKTPGTPASSCTVLDGYPMAARGEAGKALEIGLYASCIADVISNIALICFAGFLASLATQFGPPEFFTLVLFSLTIIAGVSGENLAKGLLAAGLGLIAATVGLDLIYGTDRFLFGSTQLMGGLSFIPVLVGLFALPEIIAYYGRRHDRAVARALGTVGVTWQEFRRCLKSIVRGSFLGVIMGTIPGIGGAPSAFLSYSEAQRTSPNRQNFGRGEIEGVAASEAGNNGVAGATLIPLLALGIPGDIITAIILGAFMIHGLQPGPVLFQQNLDMIYALFMGILVSSVFLLVIGKAGIRLFRRVADIPRSLLFPMVLVLCAFGSYAVNGTMFDVLVMIIMGFVGFAMLLTGLPAAPFLIAFILGPMLEDNFRRAMLMGQGDPGIFVRNEICIFFWVLTVVTVGFMVWRNLKTAGWIKSGGWPRGGRTTGDG
jgi:putative tricarboxylic transport membrane protein